MHLLSPPHLRGQPQHHCLLLPEHRLHYLVSVCQHRHQSSQLTASDIKELLVRRSRWKGAGFRGRHRKRVHVRGCQKAVGTLLSFTHLRVLQRRPELSLVVLAALKLLSDSAEGLAE
jgi:hypothetical protein